MNKVFHTFTIGKDKKKRSVTLAVIEYSTNYVIIGYSVCMPQDTFQESLARKIAEGRANSKNKLIRYYLDKELISEYRVLKSIALIWERKITESPNKYIKGIRL